MKREILSYRMFLAAVLIVGLFLPSAESFGFFAGLNSWHLDSSFQTKTNADLVCKVQIQSIRRKKIVKGYLFPGKPNLLEMVATSKVMVIKGECPGVEGPLELLRMNHKNEFDIF